MCDGPEAFALHGSSKLATLENFFMRHRGADQRSGAAVISRLIRCTVPTSTPSALAVLQIPAPAASAARTAVSALPPKLCALIPGPRKPGTDSFLNHRPLELGKDAHHLEHGLGGRRRGVEAINIKEDQEQGRRLKTTASARLVPIHPELTRIGFLHFVDWIRSAGQDARLFPVLTPGPKGGFGEAWSKWFGRYKRDLGITNKASVFHSFRHGFKDAARAARVSEDLHDALTGHIGSSVGRTYGAKDMVRRFGLETLADAVNRIKYPGLDLSNVFWTVPAKP